jgi:hypothetical protein
MVKWEQDKIRENGAEERTGERYRHNHFWHDGTG